MDQRLEQLAKLYGIDPGYHDVWGTWRVASDETVRALLAAMGVDAHDPNAVEATLAADERAAWSLALPPISVLRAAQLGRGVRIQLPEGSLGRPLAWRLSEESGEIREEPFTPLRLTPLEEFQRDGMHVHAFLLPLPTDLAEGYHRVTLLEGDTLLGTGLVAVVPEHCFLPPALAGGGRVWGAAVQLYGLCSARKRPGRIRIALGERGERGFGCALGFLVREPGADRRKAADITQDRDGTEPGSHDHGRASRHPGQDLRHGLRSRVCVRQASHDLDTSRARVRIRLRRPPQQRGHGAGPEQAQRFIRLGKQTHVRERLGCDRRNLVDAQRASYDQRGLAR